MIGYSRMIGGSRMFGGQRHLELQDDWRSKGNCSPDLPETTGP